MKVSRVSELVDLVLLAADINLFVSRKFSSVQGRGEDFSGGTHNSPDTPAPPPTMSPKLRLGTVQ